MTNPRPFEGPNGLRLPTEPEIRTLVETFYARVQQDPSISPIFTARVEEWGPHLDRMTAFWTTVLLARPGFRGDPVGKHRAIGELRSWHFDRWLELFHEVVHEVFNGETAEHIYSRAERMRAVLERRPDQPAPTKDLYQPKLSAPGRLGSE